MSAGGLGSRWDCLLPFTSMSSEAAKCLCCGWTGKLWSWWLGRGDNHFKSVAHGSPFPKSLSSVVQGVSPRHLPPPISCAQPYGVTQLPPEPIPREPTRSSREPKSRDWFKFPRSQSPPQSLVPCQPNNQSSPPPTTPSVSRFSVRQNGNHRAFDVWSFHSAFFSNSPIRPGTLQVHRNRGPTPRRPFTPS